MDPKYSRLQLQMDGAQAPSLTVSSLRRPQLPRERRQLLPLPSPNPPAAPITIGGVRSLVISFPPDIVRRWAD